MYKYCLQCEKLVSRMSAHAKRTGHCLYSTLCPLCRKPATKCEHVKLKRELLEQLKDLPKDKKGRYVISDDTFKLKRGRMTEEERKKAMEGILCSELNIY